MEKYRNGVDFDETVILLLLTLLGVTVKAASAGTRSVGSLSEWSHRTLVWALVFSISNMLLSANSLVYAHELDSHNRMCVSCQEYFFLVKQLVCQKRGWAKQRYTADHQVAQKSSCSTDHFCCGNRTHANDFLHSHIFCVLELLCVACSGEEWRSIETVLILTKR